MVKDIWDQDPGELLRVRPGFALSNVDPDATPGTTADKKAGEKQLARGAQPLRDLQEQLYAQSWQGSQDRLLVVLQAMDAAGKGGMVNHVFGEIDPYGLALADFKAPTEEERAHDFLWRIEKRVPRPGMIGVFDRSHYEDVLIQRVRGFAPPAEIERRYGAIVDFEQRLVEGGTRVLKFMLHISPEEQARRLLARLDNPAKHWKYTSSDAEDRVRWPEYMAAFETVFERTHTETAPWFVVPSNSKWYARAAVQRIVTDELRRMNPSWPAADYDIETERARINATEELIWP